MSGSVLSSVLTTDLATATSVAATTTDAAVTSSSVVDTTSAVPSTTAATSTTDPATVTTSSSVVPSSTSSVETSTSVVPTTTSTTETTPTTTSTTAAETTPSTTSAAQTTTSTADTTSTTATSTASQSTIVRTITSTQSDATITSTSTSTSNPIASASGTSSPSNDSKGLSDGAKIAIAVVIPVVVIAALLAAALWWYKRRKATQAAAEERRKEAEDYSYHPNADPTLPGSGGADATYQMTDTNAGYRGWGTTTVGSTGRKASTQLSGPVGVAYSDGTPSHAVSDGRSDNRLVDHHATSGAYSPDGEILAAMGPNPNAPHRGLSNASSTYSAAGRSDGSGDNNIGVAYASGPIANNQYYEPYSAANPYEGGYPGSPPDNYGGAIGIGEMQGSAVPIIRDNPARRNTRIENHAHFPQQSAGISQNF